MSNTAPNYPTSTSRQPSPSPSRSRQDGGALQYSSEASMLLVGVRGAGKTTLAIMAASAMYRKIIDLEDAFQAALGLSSNDYKATHGLAKCQDQQATLLRTMLDRHRRGCILVCSWINGNIQPLYQEFAKDHPIIHVVRDAEALVRLFDMNDEPKVQKLLCASRTMWRACTNFEFFNLCEKHTLLPATQPKFADRGKGPSQSLVLKHVERHLLRFLSRIYSAGSLFIADPGCPLADVLVEDRRFTYAVSLSLSNVLNKSFDLSQHIVGSDAIQIMIHNLDQYTSELTGRTKSLKERETEIADDITRGVATIRRSTLLPLILHVAIDNGLDNGDGTQGYLRLLRHCLRLAPDMVTIDLRLNDGHILDILASRQRTRVIGSYYTTKEHTPWDSPVWLDMYIKANRLGCQLARLVRPALSTNDNLGITHLRCRVAEMEDAKIPLIAYNSGTLGCTSAVFNRVLTEVRSEALEPSGIDPKFTMGLKPSITALEATKALFSSFEHNELRLHVFGQDVDYSLSPAMMTSAFIACGIPHQYRPWSTSTLQDIHDLIQDPFFGGATLTHPFKAEALSLTHAISSHAEAIGAINTLIPIRHLEPDGSVPTGARFFQQMHQLGPAEAIYGENTDWIGVEACIRRGLSPANAINSGTCGLILGAGGMARAAIYAMLKLSISNIVIYNRTSGNAKKVVSHFTELIQTPDFRTRARIEDVRFHVLPSLDQPWPADYRLPVVIISCIPTDRSHDTSIPLYKIPRDYFNNPTGGVAIDIGYKVLDTPLVVQARREANRGWVVMDGLDVLPEQGFAQFELFTARSAPRHIMRREIQRLACR
ncbi:hypothetical protein FDECE_10479 [Fusarium decemcellulare]|nr:hypothetical protein FDECE_10479 [Fusarium decemcellulare]